MTGDPNWLLSTVAQCTAALVAIIGGFLISRLITLTSERGALRRVVYQFSQQEHLASERLKQIDDELARLAAPHTITN